MAGVTRVKRMNSDFFIRDLTSKDIPEAMKIVRQEGWNQTETDWKLFIENPDNCCKCLVVDGQLVGTTTSYRFSENLAWVSMVLVNKDFRGRGYGKFLTESVLNETGDCKSIKLDATPAGEKVYEKLGFIREYSITRWVCESFTSEIHPPTDVEKINLYDIEPLVDFDKQTFGEGRKKIIDSLITNFSEFCRISKKNGKENGFALGRAGSRFYQIGPVSANSFPVAKDLISSVLCGLNKQPVVMDIPDSQVELTDWLTVLGFQRKWQFWRMYLNDNSCKGETEKQFAICGPEFG